MKRESVNTFSGGLTYDINPITTPNNVLTDGVNATFLTFNGDEMALQNDAGNTKIISSYGELNKEPYNEDKTKAKIYYKNDLVEYGGKLYYCNEDEVVGVAGEFDESKWTKVTDSIKLSEGFKPIGLKEHGGILYIVSHKRAEKSDESDEFEIGSYPSPGYRKAAIAENTTAVKVVEKVGPVDPVRGFDVVHRLGEFIQLSNLEMFPGDPYRIKFTIPDKTPDETPDEVTDEVTDYLTMGSTRKFYTFEFYLKPKEGDFIALKDIRTVDSLIPFYSDGVSFVPNSGSGKLFIKFELEDIDEFTQYSKIDGTTYYFPRLEFAEDGTFIEFDHFNVKHESDIKLNAIEMEYTLINSQTGEATEGPVLEFENISEDGEFECIDEGKNYFRVQTPNTTQILEYTFTPKNNFYGIVFNNHIIKNSIDLSIDPLLWGNHLTYSAVETGNFYFQSPDFADGLIFKTLDGARTTFEIDYLNWLTAKENYLDSETSIFRISDYKYFKYLFNNVKIGGKYDRSYQEITYGPPLFDYKKFSTASSVAQTLSVDFTYRSPAFNIVRDKYWLDTSDGKWLVPTWWNSSVDGDFNSEMHGADYAAILDNYNNVVTVERRELNETTRTPTTIYDHGYYLGRTPTTSGMKYVEVNGVRSEESNVASPGRYVYTKSISGEENLINSIKISHNSSRETSIDETYFGTFNLSKQSVYAHNKGREITLMKKAEANFEGEIKPTTYDFEEAVLNTSDNLISPLEDLPVWKSNIVSEGKAQKRYVLNNTINTKTIPTLTKRNTYTLAFYVLAKGPSTINIEILGNSYTIAYTIVSTNGRETLKAEVTTSTNSPHQNTHSRYGGGLYVHNTPIYHNSWYYSYVKYTFEYTATEATGNLTLSTGDYTFEIAELTLKSGTIIPQSVQVYQDMLYGYIDTSLKPHMYNLSEAEMEDNVLGKLYIPNTNYEIRGRLTNEL